MVKVGAGRERKVEVGSRQGGWLKGRAKEGG